MHKPLKIALYFPTLGMGGAEKTNLNLAREFLSKGLSVDIVVVSAKGPLCKQLPKGVYLNNLKSSRILLSIFKLAKYLKTTQPDVLYSSMSHANIAAIIAKIMADVNTKLFISERNVPAKVKIFSLKKYLLRKLCLYLYQKTNGLVCISKNISSDWKNLLGHSSQLPISTIYNPIITPSFYDKAQLPYQRYFSEDKKIPTIISVGRLSSIKDFPTLIRAFALLNKTLESRLIIFGEGKERKNLERLVKEKKLQDKVILPGIKNNVLPYVANADVFVSTSKSEGLAGVMIEAMALGTSVAISNGPGGNLEIIEQGKYGPIFPVGDDQTLANILLQLIKSPTDKQLLKKRVEMFHANKAVEQYLQLFEKG